MRRTVLYCKTARQAAVDDSTHFAVLCLMIKKKKLCMYVRNEPEDEYGLSYICYCVFVSVKRFLL
jgi:hypothetical protein